MRYLFLFGLVAFGGLAATDAPQGTKPAQPVAPKGGPSVPKLLPAQPAPPAQWSGFVPPLPPPRTEEAIFKISAEDLTVAYATDEKAAQQRFGNKPLIVEGMVWAHSQKNDFLTYVVLYGHPRKTYVADEQYLWLICLLDKAHQDEISTLKVGDTVRLFGQSHGLVPSQGIRAYFSAQHLSRKQ